MSNDKIVPFPSLGDSGSYAGTAWNDDNIIQWDNYLSRYPDVMKEAQRVVSIGQFPSVEAYAAWHYQFYGIKEGRNASDQITAPSDTTNTSGYTVQTVTVSPEPVASAVMPITGVSIDFSSLWTNYKWFILAGGILAAWFFLGKKK